jgi:peptidoglycan hydrolase-like protein with peptidoglycan-binding domain
VQQPEPQAQQAQNKVQQPEPQQAQQAAQPANKNPDQIGGQNTADNLSPDQVRRIQQALAQNGFSVGTLDGILGPMTKRALSQFQRKQGLRRTGMPDEQTLAALGFGGGVSNTGQGPSGSDGMRPGQATEQPRPQGR